MELSGRHAVVTGAANGIGRALAQHFHRAGARVVLADIDGAGAFAAAAELEVIRPNSALGLVADVSTERGNVGLIDRAEEAFGVVDLFFANAGVGGGTDLDTPEAGWNAAFDINVHAHRWAAKRLVPTWVERGDGYFCSTASAAGLLSQIGSAPYSVTKHAAVAFAEWLSVTYGDRGVRVSCLCPQGVNTAMLDGTSTMSGGMASNVVRAVGTVLEPSEVAAVALAVIEAETFLIAPHPEVLTHWGRKVSDYDRWLAGMRRLYARASAPER